MTSPPKIPIFEASGVRIGLSGYKSELMTQEDLRRFRRWALSVGFKIRPTYGPHGPRKHMRRKYRGESIRRAFTLDGTGPYTGIKVQCLNRVTLSQEHSSRYGKNYLRDRYSYEDARGQRRVYPIKIGTYWEGRHSRNDCDLMVECTASCFYHSTNLLGYFNITWQDLMHIPIERLFELKPFRPISGSVVGNPLLRHPPSV